MAEFTLPSFERVAEADESDIIKVDGTTFVRTPTGYKPIPFLCDDVGTDVPDTGGEPPAEEPPAEEPGTGGETPFPTYHDGDRVLMSEYPDLQAAIRDAAPMDVVVVDADERVTDYIRLKSDIKVEDAGGTLTIDDKANVDALRTDSVKNVWIDGVEIDGNKENQSGAGRGIGGASIGTVSNLRVTNTHIHDCWGNAISLTTRDNNTSITDIYLGHNVLKRSGRHGIVLGVGDGSAIMHDVIFDSNVIEDVDRAQHMGFFGHIGSVAKNAALIGNDIRKSTGEQKGSGTSLEETVHNSIIFGNTYDDVWGKTGPLITKDGRNNATVGNHVRNTKHGATVQNYEYFQPGGPPKENVVAYNDIAKCNNGIRMHRIQGGGNNVFHYNRIIDCDDAINGNSQNTEKVIENGPDVPAAEVGPPDEIGDGVVYHTPGGQVGVRASWHRGSPHPADPVQVEVETFPERY